MCVCVCVCNLVMCVCKTMFNVFYVCDMFVSSVTCVCVCVLCVCKLTEIDRGPKCTAQERMKACVCV